MLNYDLLPRHAGSFSRYFEDGIEPGSFLMAVLENNLKEACGRADDQNRHLLFEYVQWLYNEAPGGSWGSPQNVQHYLANVLAPWEKS